MRQRTASARLGETHASSPQRARLRIAAFCDAIARWVRRIGEAGLSLTPKQSISRFGNQSIGNGSAIAARCVIAEKRRERLISLCSLKAGQRVDIPKRLQSRRAHRLQPPCPRAQRKTPRRAKSGRAGFSFDFSTYQKKDADVDGFNASQRFALFFFRQAASEADHHFDSQTMRKKSAQKRATANIAGPNAFFSRFESGAWAKSAGPPSGALTEKRALYYNRSIIFLRLR